MSGKTAWSPDAGIGGRPNKGKYIPLIARAGRTCMRSGTAPMEYCVGINGRSTTNWMRELAAHYGRMRAKYPEDTLLIVFDVDGTIIDTRILIAHVLQEFDRAHQTQFFSGLTAKDVRVHESDIEPLLTRLSVPEERHGEIVDWYNQQRWTTSAIMSGHRPFRGVLEVIRWFQIQPKTLVALNTAKPERLRADTLRSLNALGQEFRVTCDTNLLMMNRRELGEGIAESKAAGVTALMTTGRRVIAYIDNEPENLQAVAEAFPGGGILLLHADTIFRTQRKLAPQGTVRGKSFDLTELISEDALPRHIQFVWHGINSDENLRQFLASHIHWAEIDVRTEPGNGELILRHDAFDETKRKTNEGLYRFADGLKRLRDHNRNVKIDFKEGGAVVDRVLELVKSLGFKDEQLWFNGNIERVQEEGFRQIAAAYPSSIRQCPIDFLAPLIIGIPSKAREIADMLTGWGINRFSVGWLTGGKQQVLDQMDRWNLDVNIYDIPDLEAFLQAVLLVPRSITSDFNFPKWNYYGHGSGETKRMRARRIRGSS